MVPKESNILGHAPTSRAEASAAMRRDEGAGAGENKCRLAGGGDDPYLASQRAHPGQDRCKA